MTYEELDIEYLNRIISYFKQNRENQKIYLQKKILLTDDSKTLSALQKKYLSELTATPKKYIDHVKYYIDIRTPEFADVTFSDDYTIIYIH